MNRAATVELDPRGLDWKGILFVDPTGRVFEHKGEIYRAIYPEAVEHVRSLFERGVIDRLVERKLLVSTTTSSLRVSGFGMVLHHGRVPFLSHAGQWPRSLLRDAARLVVDLNLELLEFGLGTIDFHPMNVQQTDGCRPVWIDLGSIHPLTGASATALAHQPPRRDRKAVVRAIRERIEQGRLKRDLATRLFMYRSGIAAVPKEFRRNYLYTLALLTRDPDWGRPVRAFLRGAGIDDAEYRLLGGKRRFPRFARERKEWLESMRTWLDQMTFPSVRTSWGSYSAVDPFASPDAGPQDPRAEVVDRVVRAASPSRIIDLGCNAGLFTAVAARAAPGCAVYAVDSDEEAIESLYLGARKWSGESAITVVLDDVLWLTLERYRIQGDFAMALALSHHLYFHQSCPFPTIASLFASFTTGSLLTEFMPNGLGGTIPIPDPLPSGYNLDNFARAFEPHFREVEVIRCPVPDGTAQRVFIHARGKL